MKKKHTRHRKYIYENGNKDYPKFPSLYTPDLASYHE